MRTCLCGRLSLVVESGRSVCAGCGRYALHCGCDGIDLVPVSAPVIIPPAEVERRLEAMKRPGARVPRWAA